MRLCAEKARAIREEILHVDPTAEIYLFGSRADDSAKGGDIDLLVISDCLDFRGILAVRRRILDRIGWQQLDLIVRGKTDVDEPFIELARQNGIKL
ncbi:MAG: hypothetical protein Fur0032_20440 [Terrimicrobiaceae bacterium]